MLMGRMRSNCFVEARGDKREEHKRHDNIDHIWQMVWRVMAWATERFYAFTALLMILLQGEFGDGRANLRGQAQGV